MAMLLWPSARPAVAAGPEFLDQRAVVFDLDAGLRDTEWTVSVVNGTAAETTMSLHVSGIPGLEPVKATSAATHPGNVATFTVKFTSEPAEPVDGSFVVTAGAASARREVRVVRASRTGPVPAVDLRGYRVAPFLDLVRVPQLDNARLAPTMGLPVEAPLHSPNGDDAVAIADVDGRLAVDGISEAGTYTGTLVVGPGREAKVTVKVRDSVLWPLATLVAGLAAVNRIEDFVRRRRPRLRARLRLLRLRDALRRDQRPGLPRVTREDDGMPALVFDHRFEQAWHDIEVVESDAGLEEWSETGQRWKAVASWTDVYRKMWAKHAALRAKLENTSPDADLRGRVVALLEKGELATEEELEAHTKALDALSTELDKPAKPASDRRRRIADDTLAPRENDVAAARRRTAWVIPFALLLLANIAVAGFLFADGTRPRAVPTITTTTTAAPAEARPAPTAVVPPVPATPGSTRASHVQTFYWAFALPLLGLAALAFVARMAQRLLHDVLPARPADAGTYEAGVAANEAAFAYITSVIVVLSGLAAVYFNNQTFGSLGDYVQAFLWGSAVGEGVKLARRLAPRLAAAG